jgi:hypothetical protein
MPYIEIVLGENIVIIQEEGRRLAESEVVAFEEELGTTLPEGYRQFLLEHNGGRPEPDVIDIEGLPGGSAEIQEFFGFGCSIESSNLDWNRAMFRTQFQEDLLPIACDSGGCIYCISIRGTRCGSIVYCDFVESKVTYYSVAPSFETMLKKLRPFK